MLNFPIPKNNTRLGFHYFPDTEHFRQRDLRAWLPELNALGANWLILAAPMDRAIPEGFLRGLLRANIEPVLHFHLPLGIPHSQTDLALLFSTYARWGLHFVILFDRPNIRQTWPIGEWVQNELVERFLDYFVPLAESARRAGLIPIFPPLEPGGDYWDTAFLRAAFQALERRGLQDLLKAMALGAYARAGDRSLNWGYGGPESWPGTRPYFTPSGSEDQRGFRIFDWYLPIVRAVTGRSIGMFLLGISSNQFLSGKGTQDSIDDTARTLRTLTIARRLAGDTLEPYMADPLELIPQEIIAGNFWLIAADETSNETVNAWYKPNGSTLPIVSTLRQWFSGYQVNHSDQDRISLNHAETINELNTSVVNEKGLSQHPITHYLLLPSFDWGIPDWYLNAIQPYVKKYKPTIGFSIEEAALARFVTVVGKKEALPEEVKNHLEAAGCKVENLDLVAQELQQES